MFFPEFPFPSHLPSFPSHHEVLKYLQDYVSHYKLEQFIKCSTQVEEITPVIVDSCNGSEREQLNSFTLQQSSEINFHNWGRFRDNVKWRVTVKNLKSGTRSTEEYDAVLVCNG